MLAVRPRPAHRIGALGVLSFLVASALLGFLAAPVRGDAPIVSENSNASRTVSWTMGTATGLTLNGVDLEGANATLPWVPANVSWDTPAKFLARGSIGPNLVANATDISLRADTTNHVLDGDFASAAPWTYESSARGNVTAGWDGGTGTAVFRHASSATEASWDTMDGNLSSWIGLSGTGWTSRIGQHEGSGMLGLNFSLPPGPSGWAGVQRSSPVNWSAYDRLVLWIEPTAPSLPLSFNVTAYVGSNLYQTAPQDLVAGWQEISVDLGAFGPVRDSLVSLTLRVNGDNISGGQVFFDDLRVGNAKRFDEVAAIRQAVVKANATTPVAGSAVLQLNWSVPTESGVASVQAVVNVSGPSGTAINRFSAPSAPGWHRFLADVSSTSSLAGLYNVSVEIRVVADNTSASAVEVRVDDVSILFPNRQNGTYLSGAVPLGATSEFLQVSWTFESPQPAVVQAKIRSGTDSTPGSTNWGSWRMWTAPGSYAPALAAGSFVQVQVDLSTTNASVSPSLRGLLLEGRHRSTTPGTISGTFTLPPEHVPAFLHWTRLRAMSQIPTGTSISYSIGNATYRRPVAPDQNFTDIRLKTLEWFATLGTIDGLAAPSLSRIDLVYEYLGPPVRVDVTSAGPMYSGQSYALNATAWDAGDHLITWNVDQFDWTADGNGQVKNGVYTAGDPGDRTVTATYRGTTLTKTVIFHVQPSDWVYSLTHGWAGITLIGLGAIGYVAYRYGVRRLFQIDDVFLISKDGRLLMHNTRRMRADRDEDILSGMLTAIVAFLKDADPEENGELKRFDVGGKTTLVERGPHAYLAAIYSGRVPRWAGKDLKRFMATLETNFGQKFAQWSGDPDDLQSLKEFTDRFVSNFRYRPPRRVNGRAA